MKLPDVKMVITDATNISLHAIEDVIVIGSADDNSDDIIALSLKVHNVKLHKEID
jgi:hypothetical protein